MIWPREGVPDSPGAWLTTVARNVARDALRRRAVEERKLRDVAAMAVGVGDDPAAVAGRGWEDDGDDRLRLVFACAHPALGMEARVALTLHAVGGLTTREIAHAFLVTESTMAQRLVRAKRRIRGAGIPFRVPEQPELPARLDGVLSVLYLVFSEGYAASGGEEWMRPDLAAEAIRLTRLVVELIEQEAGDEARALLALLLLQHSRRHARIDADGDIVPLEEQDRSAWDADLIAEASALLEQPHHVRGGYRIQAELAAQHALAPDAASTPWSRIVALYDELLGFTTSPVVRLNRAIAVAFAFGLPAGFAELDELAASGSLAGNHLLPATRADLLRRSGDTVAAAEAYRAALTLAPTEPERRFLRRRLRAAES